MRLAKCVLGRVELVGGLRDEDWLCVRHFFLMEKFWLRRKATADTPHRLALGSKYDNCKNFDEIRAIHMSKCQNKANSKKQKHNYYDCKLAACVHLDVHILKTRFLKNMCLSYCVLFLYRSCILGTLNVKYIYFLHFS